MGKKVVKKLRTSVNLKKKHSKIETIMSTTTRCKQTILQVENWIRKIVDI